MGWRRRSALDLVGRQINLLSGISLPPVVAPACSRAWGSEIFSFQSVGPLLTIHLVGYCHQRVILLVVVRAILLLYSMGTNSLITLLFSFYSSTNLHSDGSPRRSLENPIAQHTFQTPAAGNVTFGGIGRVADTATTPRQLPPTNILFQNKLLTLPMISRNVKTIIPDADISHDDRCSPLHINNYRTCGIRNSHDRTAPLSGTPWIAIAPRPTRANPLSRTSIFLKLKGEDLFTDHLY